MLETYYQEYKDRGFISIFALAENMESQPPSLEDLQAWADDRGLTIPVVDDSGWTIDNRYEKDNGIPTHTLFAPGMEIVIEDGHVTAEDIEAVLPD